MVDYRYREVDMNKQRLSFDMSADDHKNLKMCCAKLGVSIKDFIIKATLDAIHAQEDVWFSELPEQKVKVINHKQKRKTL